MTCKFPKSDYIKTGIVWTCNLCQIFKRRNGDILCLTCSLAWPIDERPHDFAIHPEKYNYPHHCTRCKRQISEKSITKGLRAKYYCIDCFKKYDEAK